MMRWLLAVALLVAPAASRSTTADDLSSRLHIDGDVSEYTADEWVLDASSLRPERPDDSRWGVNNDIRRIAVTWDRNWLYLAIDCSTYDSGVMAWLEYGAGGLGGLEAAGEFRRNIVLGSMRPNIFAWGESAAGVDVARVDAGAAFGRVAADKVMSAFASDATGAGAMELAISWDVVLASDGVVRLLAAITGLPVTGAGDAAPDASATLPASRSARAVLDNFLEIVVDADSDGVPDTGVSPVSATSVVPGAPAEVRLRPDLSVKPDLRSFAPDLGEEVRFVLWSSTATRVYATAAVYGIDGRRVRVLYEEEARSLVACTNPPASQDVWDGRDENGHVVPGGVYVLSVVWGESAGGHDGGSRVSVVVVR